MSSPRSVQFDFGGAFRRPPPATMALMVITGAVSVIGMIDYGRFGSGGFLLRQLQFTPARVMEGKLWTPFIYAFLSLEPLNLILYEVFGLWMFAAPLERAWGQRRFLFYFFGTVTGAALLTALAGLRFSALYTSPPNGTWVATEAVLLAWILMNWHATVLLFFFPVRAPFLLVLSLGLPVLYLLMGIWEPFFTPLLAMGIGYLMVGRRVSPRRAWLHLRAFWLERQLKRRASHLRVVPPPDRRKSDDEDEDKPRYLN